jgi:hypothetical protein
MIDCDCFGAAAETFCLYLLPREKGGPEMHRKHPAATVVLTALALLAGTAPSSIATAVELKGNQKKQRMLVPAVQNLREIAGRSTRTKQDNLKSNRSITVGGSRTENGAQKRAWPGFRTPRTRQTTIIQDM